MKTPRIVNSIGNIDEALVFDSYENQKKIKPFLKWSVAASFILVIAVTAAIVLPPILKYKVNDVDDSKSRYKNFEYYSESVAFVWPEEYLEVFNKYYLTEIDGVTYDINSGFELSEEYIGDEIGVYTFSGVDEITGKNREKEFCVYDIKNVESRQFIAVKMEGEFYPLMKESYFEPKTLSELLNTANFPEILQFGKFSLNGTGPDAMHYVLNDDEYIWKILEDCEKSPFVADENWSSVDKPSINFTVTIDNLGIYKHSITITEDGFLHTNIYNWGYLFEIGEEAAKKIIKYAKANCKKTEYEPYYNSIVGEVTKITDSYVLVNDSIICNDPKDATTYKIFLEDKKVSRYFDCEIIKMGDMVAVEYMGNIDDKNVVNDVLSFEEVDINFNIEE